MQKDKHLNFYHAAPDILLQDTSGYPVQLSSLWQERPLLLAFTRHFGCTQCKEMLDDLVAGKEKITEAWRIRSAKPTKLMDWNAVISSRPSLTPMSGAPSRARVRKATGWNLPPPARMPCKCPALLLSRRTAASPCHIITIISPIILPWSCCYPACFPPIGTCLLKDRWVPE